MTTIKNNGVEIEIGVGNVTVLNNKVIVDGKEIEIDKGKDVYIEGDVGSLKCNGSAQVTGNVGGNVDAGGSVRCGDVGGDVDAGGSVTAKNVKQDIDAGGSVHISKG